MDTRHVITSSFRQIKVFDVNAFRLSRVIDVATMDTASSLSLVGEGHFLSNGIGWSVLLTSISTGENVACINLLFTVSFSRVSQGGRIVAAGEHGAVLTLPSPAAEGIRFFQEAFAAMRREKIVRLAIAVAARPR
jgi:hypothetical protein